MSTKRRGSAGTGTAEEGKEPRARGIDEVLAARVRAFLATRDDVVEKRMFGGLCFMVAGAMCCGLTKDGFMVRVGANRFEEALAQPHARPMDFTGKPLTGMVYVASEGLAADAALAAWVGRGLAFVTTRTPDERKPADRSRRPG